MTGTLPSTVNGEAVKLDLLTLVERASEMRTSEDGWAQHLGGERWLEGVGETPDGQRVTVKAVGDFDLLTDIGAAVSGVHERRRLATARMAFADGTADESQIALVALESPTDFSALWRSVEDAIEPAWTANILLDGFLEDAVSRGDIDKRAAALRAAVSPAFIRSAARADRLTLSEAAAQFARTARALRRTREYWQSEVDEATLSLQNRPTDIDERIIGVAREYGAALENLLAAALNG